MKKCALLSIFLFFSVQFAFAAMFECTYKNKKEVVVTSSFNTLNKHHPNYEQLKIAYKNGNCKELIVKRYFIDGTICNIQFYKYNKQLSHLTCPAHRQDALPKLKEIARRDFGYYK